MTLLDRILFGRKLSRFLRKDLPAMITGQVRLTAKPIYLPARHVGECVNCGRGIARTATNFPWYHGDTGSERCDGRPSSLASHEQVRARPARREIALPALKTVL